MAKQRIKKTKLAKKVKKKTHIDDGICKDKLCPIHGGRKLKMRGRVFKGVVSKKLHGRISVILERMVKIPKYERYEKRKTKIHARLPECFKNVSEGDLVLISETRPISKTIHFVVSKIVKSGNISNESNKF